MNTYYRIPGRSIIHRRRNCPRLRSAVFGGYVTTVNKKPSRCTICDHCQALDARDKRLAKKLRPMAKRLAAPKLAKAGRK